MIHFSKSHLTNTHNIWYIISTQLFRFSHILRQPNTIDCRTFLFKRPGKYI